MRRLKRTIIGMFAQFMAASWLFQMMLPALCCCCYAADGTAVSARDNGLAYPAMTCCCQPLFGHFVSVDGAAASHSVADCRGMSCETCASNGCFRGMDNRELTIRRRPVGVDKKLADQPVMPWPSVLSNSCPQWPVPSGTDTFEKGVALSAADRCVCLQRLLL